MEEEEEKIGMMRAVVRREEPELDYDDDDGTLRRFLVARDMDVDRASKMYLKFRRWRRSFMPSGSISEAEVASHLAHHKMFLQGRDRTGRPIVVVFGARHKQTNLPDFKRKT